MLTELGQCWLSASRPAKMFKPQSRNIDCQRKRAHAEFAPIVRASASADARAPHFAARRLLWLGNVRPLCKTKWHRIANAEPHGIQFTTMRSQESMSQTCELSPRGASDDCLAARIPKRTHADDDGCRRSRAHTCAASTSQTLCGPASAQRAVSNVNEDDDGPRKRRIVALVYHICRRSLS